MYDTTLLVNWFSKNVFGVFSISPPATIYMFLCTFMFNAIYIVQKMGNASPYVHVLTGLQTAHLSRQTKLNFMFLVLFEMSSEIF